MDPSLVSFHDLRILKKRKKKKSEISLYEWDEREVKVWFAWWNYCVTFVFVFFFCNIHLDLLLTWHENLGGIWELIFNYVVLFFWLNNFLFENNVTWCIWFCNVRPHLQFVYFADRFWNVILGFFCLFVESKWINLVSMKQAFNGICMLLQYAVIDIFFYQHL